MRRCAMVAVIGYVAFHVLKGDYAPTAIRDQERELLEAEARVAELQLRHDGLQQRVSGLSRTSLNLDLLDERARLILGWAGPNDYVFVVDADVAAK